MTRSTSLTTTRNVKHAEKLPDEREALAIGQWYWVDEDDGDDWLGCITHVGSNYFRIEGVHEVVRVHIDAFDRRCRRETDPDAHIDKRVAHYQNKVSQLMGRVREITARLGVAPSQQLNANSETRALATVNRDSDNMDSYKAALVKAKKDDLPDLFKEIDAANRSMAEWMGAKVIPLRAQAQSMKGVVSTIEDRIFSVQLYAGLTEDVTQIADGEPAAIDDKLHLLQRRHYMDEECLAQYTTGGMDFQGIDDFDTWLTRPENRDRLLPFPRCMVAFQVRRHSKKREIVNLRDFINFVNFEQADKWTFLYIRNGEQLFRMYSSVEFSHQLFPDAERSHIHSGQKLWALQWEGGIRHDEIITENAYQSLREDYERQCKQYEAKKKTAPTKDHWWIDRPHMKGFDHFGKWVPFTPSNVYFDDIAHAIGDKLKQHNRVALIIQGLLDRSPVLHPHPPWQIWTQEGFEAAIELVYDQTRALVAGDTPDFEAYRQKLNATLKTGSVTVGQQDAWELHEGKKESERMSRDYRCRSDYRPQRHRPYGNPGPGELAKIFRYAKRSGKATYAWHRERLDLRSDRNSRIRTTFSCSASTLLNVDAYTPGDFRIFFDDPRTRTEYLKWAPLLLQAEEYHAGNREVSEAVKPKPRPASSWEGKMRYRRRKLREKLMGCAVRLTREISTEGGDVYSAGSLWRVVGGKGATFEIAGITEPNSDGDAPRRWVSGVHASDFAVDDTIARDE